MTRFEGEQPIRRALLDIVQNVRGLVTRTRGVCELGVQDGQVMHPMMQRARELLNRLTAAVDVMSIYEDGDPTYRIDRDLTGRGAERIVIRCVQNVLSNPDLFDEPKREAPEPPAERVDLRGNNWSIGVPDLLTFLESLGKSGTLLVDTFSETFTVVLEKGRVVHASSDASPIGLRLGDILVHQGATTLEDLREFLAAHENKAERIGDSVIQGLVTRDQLETALRFQVQQLFHRLFEARDATFTFYDGKSNSPSVSVRMNLTRLLLESSVEIGERTVRADAEAEAESKS